MPVATESIDQFPVESGSVRGELRGDCFAGNEGHPESVRPVPGRDEPADQKGLDDDQGEYMQGEDERCAHDFGMS
jgi:hypothetical protein